MLKSVLTHVYRADSHISTPVTYNALGVNSDAAVFINKLVASIEQRIMLEKALGQLKVDPDWELPDSDED